MKRLVRATLFFAMLATVVACGTKPVAVSSPEPRFSATSDGTVLDFATGLEWFVGPDRKTFVADARRFVEGLRAGGREDWRLPSFRELRSLYQPGRGPKNLDPLLTTRGDMLWSGDVAVFGYTYLRLVDGTIGWDTLGRRKHGFRAFAVRGPRWRDAWGN